MSLINKDFGKYLIEKELGKGGMATVYLGVHKDLGRKVALKIMHPHLATDVDARARFETEAKAIARLEHVNILQVYDFGDHENNFYIAMELISGRDADKFLKENGPLPPEIVALVFYGIANGLNQAHLHGIIHRDIKLSNIIINKDGLVKLSDFGIVKIEDSASMTHSNSIVGTPYYIAPEQVEGGKASIRSDIYALGVSMYYALSGHYPFKAETLPLVLNAISAGKYLPLKECSIHIPQELAVVVERCMSRDPKGCYESSLQIASDLNSFLYKRQIANDATTIANYIDNPGSFMKTLRENSIRVRLLRARSFKEKNMLFEALQEFESILQEDPGNKDVELEIKKLGEVKLSRPMKSIDMETTFIPIQRKRRPFYITIGAMLLFSIILASYYIIKEPKSPMNSIKLTDLASGSNAESLAVPEEFLLPMPTTTLITDSPSARPEKRVVRDSAQKKKMDDAREGNGNGKQKDEEKQQPVTIQDSISGQEVLKKEQIPCSGFIFVFSELWGSIYLNDRKIGEAPTKNKLSVACGDYMLRIDNPSGKSYSEAVRIVDGETLKRQVKESDFK